MNQVRSTSFRQRRLLIALPVLALLLILGWYLNEQFSLEQIAAQEDRLRDYIALNPGTAFAGGFAIYLVLAFIPGTGGKAVVVGWFFGFFEALLIVSIGLSIAAMGIFWLSRYLLRDSIERRYPNVVGVMNRHLEEEGVFYLLFLRMAHAPYSIVNPVSGASRVQPWTFFWTTFVGLMPANMIWIYVGLRLPSLRELAESGPAAFIDLPLFITLVFCGLFPLIVRWLNKKWQAYTSYTPKDDDDVLFS